MIKIGNYLVAVALCGIVACTAAKKVVSSSDNDLVLGSLSVGEGTSSPIPIFPHPDNWETPSSHGEWVEAGGYDGCLKCHGQSTPQESGLASCASCHTLYPHASGWLTDGGHGDYVVANGSSECATACHGTDLNGGLSGTACESCHETYPHVSGWREATQHGITAAGSGKQVCQSCHGSDFAGGISTISCFNCHSQYPHGANWVEPTQHGSWVVANGSSGCQSECHGTDLKGGLSGVGCQTCHDIYPHTSDWTHAHQTQALEIGLVNCQGCHGTDYQRMLNGKNCYSCHDGYPHASGWVSRDKHGKSALENQAGCAAAACHGAGLAGSATAPGCNECHADYPHQDPSWVDGADSAHITTFMANISAGKSDCTECHGDNYDREMNGTSCMTCHINGVTHGVGWSTGHGSHFSKSYSSNSVGTSCAACHGSGVDFTDSQLLRDNGVGNCMDCHFLKTVTTTQTKGVLAAQSQCYSCHAGYPHTAYHLVDKGGVAHDVGWGPSTEDESSSAHGYFYGHVYFLMRSPLLTDSSGSHPSNPMGITGAQAFDVIQTSCGGQTPGSCHYNGARSEAVDMETNLCSSYCHQSANP